MDETLQASVYASGMERSRLSVDDYLERFKKRHVLLLGDFGSEGIKRIERIREVLTDLGYYAFTLKDIREVPEYDLRQKLNAVAPVCRFVVVDDSSRAGQVAEIPILEMLRVTAVVMRARGANTTFVTRPLNVTSNVIREVDYDQTDVGVVLADAARWADTRIQDQVEAYADAYPWRSSRSPRTSVQEEPPQN